MIQKVKISIIYLDSSCDNFKSAKFRFSIIYTIARQKKFKKCQKINNANNINIFYEFLIKFSYFTFWVF